MKTIMLIDANYDEIMEKLDEIINKIGPYKIDNHKHALSVMDNSSKNAERIRSLLRSMIVEES
jgi:hypothetical protein